jgi:hypothetical protein
MSQLLKRIWRVFSYDKWNIGVARLTCDDLLAKSGLGEVSWLAETSADFRADPFVIVSDGAVYVFYEEFHHHRGPGVLKCFTMKGDAASAPELISLGARYSCHQSYPYVFCSDDKHYMVPELHEMRTIDLFCAQSFPSEWTYVATVAQGAPFVDSSVFFSDNLWWVISSCAQETGKIYIYSSSSLEGPWKPHSLNPIAVEADGARGAGRILVSGGKIYRPTQLAGSPYGSGIQMNEIQISEDAFQQRRLFALKPEQPYSLGLHNIDISTDLAVIDGKRRRFSLLAPAKKALERMSASSSGAWRGKPA